MPPSEPALKRSFCGDRKAHPPAADPNANSATDLIRNKELRMPESIGNERSRCPNETSPKWDHEPGGDLNAEQINQIDISRPSSRRVLRDLAGRGCRRLGLCSGLHTGDGRAPRESGAGKLADDPRQLQGLELQRARSDQRPQCQESRTG